MAAPSLHGSVSNYDNTSMSDGDTETFTVTSGADILIVCLHSSYESALGGNVSVTSNQDTLTLLKNVNYGTNNGGSLWVYYVVNPTVATHTLTVNFDAVGGQEATLGVQMWADVNTSDPFLEANEQSASGTSTSPSLSVTGTTNDVILDWFSKQMSAASETVTAGQTQNWEEDTGNAFLALQARSQSAAGTGSAVSMGYTCSSGTRGWSHYAVPLQGTAASGASLGGLVGSNTGLVG